ncbi:hypothetical protein MNBD_GAMMA11-3348 [hydrothermal vent metagenome]|uniref:Uncharacterized protein n=1 Tax=hydrothermal vent metagenome TaxID=652676 RepID=A0A3B0X5M4_9ZZZZ
MLTLLIMLGALLLTAYFWFMTDEPKIIRTAVSGLFVVSLLMTHIIPGIPFLWIIGLIIQTIIAISLITYIKMKVLN